MFEFNHVYIAGLVRKAQQHDNDAFAELYALTYQKQYQYARNYLRDEFLAQDALQEVYILALKNLEKLQEPKVFVAWLKQINFRVCYNMMQKERRFITDNLDTTPETSYANYASIPDPEDEIIRKSESDRLERALEQLPEKERLAILCRFSRKMKMDDISVELGVSLSTTKRIVNRACDHLQEILGKE